MGSIMTLRLLNNRFSFWELNIHYLYEIFSVDKRRKPVLVKHWRKKYLFSAIVHLQKAPSSASSENAPLIGENIIISAHIRKKSKLDLILFNQSFGKYLEPQKELPDLRSWNHCKNVGLVKHLGIFSWISWRKKTTIFFYFKDYCIRNKIR